MAIGQLAAAGTPISFQRDIAPLLAKECAYCHMVQGPDAGLILEPHYAYAMTVGVPSSESSLLRIEPGKPERSYLMFKLWNRHREVQGRGTKMPPGWRQSTVAEIALVGDWIAAGAPNN